MFIIDQYDYKQSSYVTEKLFIFAAFYCIRRSLFIHLLSSTKVFFQVHHKIFNGRTHKNLKGKKNIPFPQFVIKTLPKKKTKNAPKTNKIVQMLIKK